MGGAEKHKKPQKYRMTGGTEKHNPPEIDSKKVRGETQETTETQTLEAQEIHAVKLVLRSTRNRP